MHEPNGKWWQMKGQLTTIRYNTRHVYEWVSVHAYVRAPCRVLCLPHTSSRRERLLPRVVKQKKPPQTFTPFMLTIPIHPSPPSNTTTTTIVTTVLRYCTHSNHQYPPTTQSCCGCRLLLRLLLAAGCCTVQVRMDIIQSRTVPCPTHAIPAVLLRLYSTANTSLLKQKWNENENENEMNSVRLGKWRHPCNTTQRLQQWHQKKISIATPPKVSSHTAKGQKTIKYFNNNSKARRQKSSPPSIALIKLLLSCSVSTVRGGATSKLWSCIHFCQKSTRGFFLQTCIHPPPHHRSIHPYSPRQLPYSTVRCNFSLLTYGYCTVLLYLPFLLCWSVITTTLP